MVSKFIECVLAWKKACDLPNYRIAVLAGVSEKSVRNLGVPGKRWNPTLETLLALEKAMPKGWTK